ncbi:putative SWI SNF-related matrix-associated actin-dependent regulator of chromatin subfamily A member 3-like 3 [Parachaetomium inaequale]|uniref:SWI SNF-related matrix-associated actin-dependent regulator of chromatin subfamily A member 3-like 3 n=1 Tax=Parachaetomium inaequale TaxID=2588326 RepID=A0AAN6P801_9PEZI|nr:putative SWI SNF-related matrix-associated actin-dependent regulator of chromatin subfamily A member 3-like 3 [Parachaetomium inaequale]
MTSELSRPGIEVEFAHSLFQSIPGETDILEVLDVHQDLPEASQPELILPVLKSFVNTVSQTCQEDEPSAFCGGIVADPMGLGKTLTMIALVAVEKHSSSLARALSLIIVPPPFHFCFLDAFGPNANTILRYVMQGGLTWHRYYGKDKLSVVDYTPVYDIVLSTYNTVSVDWGGGQKAASSVIFSIPWKRLILDEVCALEATVRWAVTGTPIQNRTGDLAALLKFVRMWKTVNIEEAINRLRKLSRGLILRRPKIVIELPPRIDLKFPIEFRPSERQLYEKVKHQTIANIEEAFQDGDRGGLASNSYITVMQRINALRMICDLGLNYDDRHELGTAGEAQNPDLPDWSTIAQETFSLHREVSSVVCSSCASSWDNTAAPFVHTSTESSPQPYFAKCLSYICGDFAQRCHRQNQAVTCGHTPNHSIAPVSMSWMALEENGVPADSRPAFSSSGQLSSKVTALVLQLRGLPDDVKSVVFSSWRMSLNLVEMGLKESGIKYVRFDGKVRQQDRQAVIEKFRKDPTARVFLLTLSCGAVGLTLTEASRAYLLEPHWNPTIEEQALARVYRIGQQREETTVRFFIKDTFEERILDLQRSKKKLEESRFSVVSTVNLSFIPLQDLRRLI